VKAVRIDPYQVLRYLLLGLNAYWLGASIWTRDWASATIEAVLVVLIAIFIQRNAQPAPQKGNDDDDPPSET